MRRFGARAWQYGEEEFVEFVSIRYTGSTGGADYWFSLADGDCRVEDLTAIEMVYGYENN